MITQVFTFGYGHVCPYTGQKLDDHYATITAPTEDHCVALMLALFDRQWAFQYDTAELAGVNRFGLIEHMRLTVGQPTPLDNGGFMPGGTSRIHNRTARPEPTDPPPPATVDERKDSTS